MNEEAETPNGPAEHGLRDLSDRFSRLFLLASQNFRLGLKYWTDEILPHIDTDNDLDDLAQRTLDRFASLARAKAAPDDLAAVETQIAAAQAQLTRARGDRHARDLNAIVRGFQRGIRRTLRNAPAARRPSFRELQDLLVLEEKWGAQPLSECLAWLEDGLRRARAEPLEAHLAFAPLRLFPSERWLEQLAATLLEGIDAELDVPERLRDAVIAAVTRDGSVRAQVDLDLDRDLWRLLAGLRPARTCVPEARSYLLWLRDLPDVGAAERAAAVRAVCLCVDAVSPGSTAQVAFFEWLKRQPQLWASEFALLGIRAQRRADEAEHLRPSRNSELATARLTGMYADDLEAIAKLDTAEGRRLADRLTEEIFGQDAHGSRGSRSLQRAIAAAVTTSVTDVFVLMPTPRDLSTVAPLFALVGA